MPGYILHLTAAQIALNYIEKQRNIKLDDKFKNEFFIGSLLPDTVSDKKASHFRNPFRQEEMIEYPDLRRFLDKYESLLGNVSCLGYYFHLYIDYKFFTEYLPSIVAFGDEEGHVVTKRDEVIFVEIKRTGQRILKETFFSKEYYYGDYTRMNTYLKERYHLPLQLELNVENPGIEEVDYSDVKKVLEELQGYLGVSKRAVKELKVFEVEKLENFLEKETKKFVERVSEEYS